MSYVMTYTSLEESLKRYVWRESDTDLDTEFPRLLDSAERTVARALKSLLTKQHVTGNLQAGVSIVQKPVRWLETIAFRFLVAASNTSIELKQRTESYVRTVYPIVTTQGQPVYYVDYDMINFFLAPAPDLAYLYQLEFYERPEPLGPTVSTNILTEYAPDVLLYALLLEAAPFLEDPQTDEWKAGYARKLGELGLEDDSRKISESQKMKGSRK